MKCNIGESLEDSFNNDRQDIIETHMPRLNDRQTVYSKQTADPQTADIQLAPQTAVLPLQAANLESRLREGSIYFNFFKKLKQMGYSGVQHMISEMMRNYHE